jgi:hypothetical protein
MAGAAAGNHGSNGGGAGAGAGAGTGSGGGGTGSASALGAPKVIAAAIPSAPDITASAFASKSILTNGPLPVTA